MQSVIYVSASKGKSQGEESQTEEDQQCIYYSMTDSLWCRIQMLWASIAAAVSNTVASEFCSRRTPWKVFVLQPLRDQRPLLWPCQNTQPLIWQMSSRDLQTPFPVTLFKDIEQSCYQTVSLSIDGKPQIIHVQHSIDINLQFYQTLSNITKCNYI